MTITLLKETNCIKKYKCEINISQKRENHLDVCMVECTGKSRKNNWTHLFYSVYDGYAMLHEKCLMDLPGKLFMVYQINEHSKGAHIEYETQIMNLQGQVLSQFTSGYYSDFFLEDKYVWFLKSGGKRFNFSSDPDLDLIKLNTHTGKVKQIIKLNYTQLLGCEHSYVFSAKLTEKKNKILLKIKYRDDLKYERVKHIPVDELKI